MARFARRSFGGGFGDRRFGGPRDDLPKPVNVGEEYDVEISEVGSKGDGIARVKNFVVFVNGAKEGEKTHIKIKEVRDRFAIGEKTEAGAAVTEKAVTEKAVTEKAVTEKAVEAEAKEETEAEEAEETEEEATETEEEV
jgi:predicted RNA-binding protein with TRAM domain